MTYAKDLIDKAAEMCGSRYALAKAINVRESHLSEAANGKRQVPMEWVPCLAAVAGVDAKEALARAMAEKLPEESIGRRALGGVFAAGVAVMLLFSQAGEASAKMAGERPEVTSFTTYTSWNVVRALVCLAVKARRLAGLLFTPRATLSAPRSLHACPAGAAAGAPGRLVALASR